MSKTSDSFLEHVAHELETVMLTPQDLIPTASWMPEIAGSIVGGTISALVAVTVVSMTRRGDRRRMQAEFRIRSAERMQEALSTFLKIWIMNENYSVGEWQVLMKPAFYELYLDLSTVSPGVRSKEIDEYVSESNEKILKPILELSRAMVGVSGVVSSEYSEAELRAATKDIDDILGDWAVSTFNIMVKWREAYVFERSISLDEFAGRVTKVVDDLKASRYESRSSSTQAKARLS